MRRVLLFIALIGPLTSIFIEDGGGRGGRGGGGGGFFDSSNSWSSEEHHHHPPRPRPPRPGPRPRPPPGPAPPPAPRPACPANWYTSHRPQGTWCLRVGIGRMDYNGAIAQCATYGGVLSGIQNDWERNRIATEANRQTLAYNIQYSGVWLGAQRRIGTNTFYWTDGHTTGTAGFKWGPTQPDNSPTYGQQNCVQLIALADGYWNNPGQWRTYKSGDLDDYWCNNAMQEPVTRMYACGRALSSF